MTQHQRSNSVHGWDDYNNEALTPPTPNHQPPHDQSPGTPTTELQQFGPRLNIFGNKFAMTIQSSYTRTKQNGNVVRGGKPTVTIDVAKAMYTGRPQSGKNKYDWKNKGIFQLTPAELPHLALAILSQNTVTFKNHGDDNNKTLEYAINEKNQHLLKYFHQDFLAIVRLAPSDLFYLQSLLLRQLREATQIDGSDLITALKVMAKAN